MLEELKVSTKLLIKAVLGLLWLFAISCNHQGPKGVESFRCDVEQSNDSALFDPVHKLHFAGKKQISTAHAKSGKHSLRLDATHPFAFGTHAVLKTRYNFALSFWQYGDSDKVFAVVQSDSSLYLKSNSVVGKDSAGWKKIQLYFSIPQTLKGKKISLYIWNVSKKTVFVDDFELKAHQVENLGLSDSLLWIYTTQLSKIKKERQKALDRGVLKTTDDSWVKALAMWGDDAYKIKMRLKGDWLDHLYGKKWSFRIKIKNNASFKGMRVFSIQNPLTRHYLDQWFLYNVFRGEGLLAPRYGFIKGQLNKTPLGIYAYEEHFQKQLIESQKRREGPILKHSEDAFWDVVLEYKKNDKWYNYPIYEASKIMPFSEGKTMKNKTLTTEFNIAKNLLYQHKLGLAEVSDIFDVKKAARFFALINVMQGWHGLRWHNQRYYYNPITSKLEYVVYDNYVSKGVFDLIDRPIFGDFNNKKIPDKTEVVLNFYLFKDSTFVNNYIEYLKKYSRQAFWDSVFLANDKQIAYYENVLATEFPKSKFNRDLYYSQAARIRSRLPAYIEKVNHGLYDSIVLPIHKADFYAEKPMSIFLKSYVHVYTQERSEEKLNLRAVSYYPADIQIIGFKTKKSENSISPVDVKAYQSSENTREFSLPAKAKYVIVSHGNEKAEIEILPWAQPSKWTPRQELEQNNVFPRQDYYKVEGNKVIFSGTHTVDQIIFIPQHYQVIFEAGANYDFVKGASFLSYAPVKISGTEAAPVKIFSSDRSAKGFSVLQAGKVEMTHAVFDGFDTFSYKGWQLSGGVTIYECDTRISDCQFINNQCEDDLNIVHSRFDVRNCSFENTYSDAFDSDFCTGTVSDCYFNRLGNDAIDFSTSTIDIVRCDIKDASDKAVSGGEASHLTLDHCNIDGANIGIASKDKSVVKVSNTTINNTSYVLTAFQKKPEYGAATIIAKHIKASAYGQMSLIEKRSLLILDGQKTEGKFKNVAKKFY